MFRMNPCEKCNAATRNEQNDYGEFVCDDCEPSDVSTWMGEDIEHLPKEKLVEIIRHMGRELDAARDRNARDREMSRAVVASLAPTPLKPLKPLEPLLWPGETRSEYLNRVG